MPGPDPVQLAERHQQRAPAAEADDLGGDRRPPPLVADQADLADLDLEAGRLDDQSDQVADTAAAAREVGVLERVRGAGERGLSRAFGSPSQRGDDDLAGALELGLERRVDLAGLGAQDHAAARDAAVGLHVAVLDPAELGLQRRAPTRRSPRGRRG